MSPLRLRLGVFFILLWLLPFWLLAPYMRGQIDQGLDVAACPPGDLGPCSCTGKSKRAPMALLRRRSNHLLATTPKGMRLKDRARLTPVDTGQTRTIFVVSLSRPLNTA
jgi:hypothetical protein